MWCTWRVSGSWAKCGLQAKTHQKRHPTTSYQQKQKSKLGLSICNAIHDHVLMPETLHTRNQKASPVLPPLAVHYSDFVLMLLGISLGKLHCIQDWPLKSANVMLQRIPQYWFWIQVRSSYMTKNQQHWPICAKLSQASDCPAILPWNDMSSVFLLPCTPTRIKAIQTLWSE